MAEPTQPPILACPDDTYSSVNMVFKVNVGQSAQSLVSQNTDHCLVSSFAGSTESVLVRVGCGAVATSDQTCAVRVGPTSGLYTDASTPCVAACSKADAEAHKDNTQNSCVANYSVSDLSQIGFPVSTVPTDASSTAYLWNRDGAPHKASTPSIAGCVQNMMSTFETDLMTPDSGFIMARAEATLHQPSWSTDAYTCSGSDDAFVYSSVCMKGLPEGTKKVQDFADSLTKTLEKTMPYFESIEHVQVAKEAPDKSALAKTGLSVGAIAGIAAVAVAALACLLLALLLRQHTA